MMTRRILVALAFAGICFAVQPQAAPPPGFTLQSVTVELPNGSEHLPAEPGVDVVAANCTVCHSVGMIMSQPKLPRAAWEAEVNKMINVYKAPVQAADVPAIVAYLSAVKGS